MLSEPTISSGVKTVGAKAGPAGGDELAHQLRMPDSELEPDSTTHAVAEDVDLVDTQVAQQDSGVIRHLLVAEGTINAGGAPVPLLLDTDDLAVRGKRRQHRAEIGLDIREGAVQQE